MYSIIIISFLCGIVRSNAGLVKLDNKPSVDTDELGFRYYAGVGYVNYSPIPSTWEEARLKCFYKGGVLMSPVNKQMQEVQASLATRPMWTGVHSTYYRGIYYSIKGEPLSKMPITWAKDEPDNHDNNENCLVMLPGGEMADCSCDEVYPYACYKSNNFKTAECDHLAGYELDLTTNSCYKFHNVAQNWNTAFMVCSEEGAHLAVIDTKGEAEVLKQLFSKYPNHSIKGAEYTHFAHIGFLDWKNHNLWMTINGKSIDDLVKDKIAFWDRGEPNDPTELCGSILRTGGLNDDRCSHTVAFICEYEKK